MWVSFCCTDIDSTFVNVNFSKFVSSPLIPQQGGRVRIWRVIWRANSFASHPSLIKSNCADCAGKVIYKEGLNNVIGTISGWSSEEVDSGIRAGHVFAHGLKFAKLDSQQLDWVTICTSGKKPGIDILLSWSSEEVHSGIRATCFPPQNSDWFQDRMSALLVCI